MTRLSRPIVLAALCIVCLLGAGSALAQPALPPSWDEPFRLLEPLSRTGILIDRVLPLAGLDRLDGSTGAPAITPGTWRQAYDELRRASLASAGPPLAEIDRAARAAFDRGVIPLALFDRAYERLRPGALDDGSLRIGGGRLEPVAGSPLVAARAVGMAALAARTCRGAAVRFALDPERLFADPPPRALEIDFADGLGFRAVAIGETVPVRYETTGPRALSARITRADGSTAEARFAFEVAALAAPAPDDTLHVTATVPFQGQFGTGDAYVLLAPGHAGVVNPIVLIEGFDLENSMNWDELYALLNQEGLVESLRAEGFDLVVLNFTDGTVAIEQNGYLVAELIQTIQGMIAPQATLAVVGASMGGLCSRYALAYLESQAYPHRVRTWISFDGPHAGADIPLGLQYWINFFASQSADAAAFLDILQRPAAREMLLHHFTTPPGATGQPDPMRATMLASFAAVGDYPSLPRRVAIGNGSGTGTGQGFAPAEQLIRWEYSSPLVAVTGNVWAVPDQALARIFQGSIRILFSTTSQAVDVSGTLPWDGAPGGSRASLAELDAVPAPYGDIVALHPAHCFIPTVSALALSTGDPFFAPAGAPDPLALTPFDAIYYPAANQAHVLVTAENAAWLRSELTQGLVSVPPGAPPGPVLGLAPASNPFRDEARLTYTLSAPGAVTLAVFDVRGRAVRELARGMRPAGSHRATWDGHDATGAPAPSGIYFARLEVDGRAIVRRIARLD